MRPGLSARGTRRSETTACERAGEREAHLGLLVRRIERQHAVDRLRRVRRVQRGEDEVAGVGRLERRVERFEISNFADEDDVRVLAQHAAQRLAERRRVGADFALVDVAVDVAMQELDRILDRDDVRAAILVDVLDHRRERRRLARSGDAGDEHEAARLHRDLLEHRRQVQLARSCAPGTEWRASRSRASRAADTR